MSAARRERVLYLDDDDAMVFLVTRMLERAGYRASGYQGAQEALDAVRDDPQRFDLVVTDYNMPRLSGLEVAREIARLSPDLPVMLTTGDITEDLRSRARAARSSIADDRSTTVSRSASRITGTTSPASV